MASPDSSFAAQASYRWHASRADPLPRFDPTFVLLATLASVEAIFLSTFVIISRNRMQALADRRADLDLHVSLLAEHEVTRIVTIVSEIGRQMGIEAAQNPELADLEDYDKGEDLAEIARDFALMRELDVRTWLGSFGWDDYEPERGRYDFEWLHAFAELARREGIELRPYITYTPEWASGSGTDGDAWNDPPARLDDWGRFVDTLVSALGRHPNILSYEIYNEENVPQWWDGTSAQYNGVLERGTAAIRARIAMPRFCSAAWCGRTWIFSRPRA